MGYVSLKLGRSMPKKTINRWTKQGYGQMILWNMVTQSFDKAVSKWNKTKDKMSFETKVEILNSDEDVDKETKMSWKELKVTSNDKTFLTTEKNEMNKLYDSLWDQIQLFKSKRVKMMRSKDSKLLRSKYISDDKLEDFAKDKKKLKCTEFLLDNGIVVIMSTSLKHSPDFPPEN